MLIWTLAKTACPEFVLRQNKVYQVSRALGKKLLNPPGGGGVPGWKEGTFTPCAEIYDPKKHRKLRKDEPLTVQSPPDPLDNADEDFEDEDDDLEIEDGEGDE